MARHSHTHLPDPIFHEPIFGETDKLPDPNGFATAHPSDGQLYKEIGDLLTKDVVAVPPSRAAVDAVVPLAVAYGSMPARSSFTRSAIPAHRTSANIPTSCMSPTR